MRIIAGSLGGRQFASPPSSKTHPMSDKGRGALFNTLGDIGGLTVLDPFCGSGALSFEAISRGAAGVTALEKSVSAQKTIAENIAKLDLAGSVKLIKASANAWLTTTDDEYDLILLDPPFKDLQMELLYKLADRTRIKGVVVFSLPPRASVVPGKNFEHLATKLYGDNQLVFYRRIA
jgi:16S rRNA (guanine966-N2)-methyltransferase